MSGYTRALLIGFVAGAVTVAALPVLVPFVEDVGRPVGKALLKHSLLAIERLRTALARAAESIEDLVAEVRVEVDSELAKAAGADVPAQVVETPARNTQGPRPSSSLS